MKQIIRSKWNEKKKKEILSFTEFNYLKLDRDGLITVKSAYYL